MAEEAVCRWRDVGGRWGGGVNLIRHARAVGWGLWGNRWGELYLRVVASPAFGRYPATPTYRVQALKF